MRSVFKIVGAILVAAAVLIFLFRNAATSVQPTAAIHSTLQDSSSSPK
jgi:hypothetical protein